MTHLVTTEEEHDTHSFRGQTDLQALRRESKAGAEMGRLRTQLGHIIYPSALKGGWQKRKQPTELSGPYVKKFLRPQTSLPMP